MTSPDLPLEAAAPARSPTVAKRAGWSALAIGFSVVGVVWGRRRLILSVLEITVICAVTWYYAEPLHSNFSQYWGLPGREHQRLSGILIPIQMAWQENHEIAMWNPYLAMGKPLMGNPFNYVWNPVASVPFFAFGAAKGTTLAAILSLIVAGIGMWLWAMALKLGLPARLFAGILYALSGGIISKFGIGHFQLGLSLAWIPWAFAGLFFLLQDESRGKPRRQFLGVMLLSGGASLTFLSGNIFYSLPLAVSLILIGAVHIMRYVPDVRGGLRPDWYVIRSLLAAAVLAIGLSAVLLVPVYHIHDYIGGHPDDEEQEGSQPLTHGVTNYLIRDPEFYRAAPLALTPWVGDSYAYVGLVPVALIALAPLATIAVQKRRKPVVLFSVLLVLMLAWAGNRHTPLKHIYDEFTILYQFRFPGRFYAMGAVFLIILSAYGVQAIWEWIRQYSLPRLPDWSDRQQILRQAKRTGLAILTLPTLGLLLATGVEDAGDANQDLLKDRMPTSPELDAALTWLSEYDPDEYYVNIAYSLEQFTYATYDNGIRYQNLNEGWLPEPEHVDWPLNYSGPIPHYQIALEGEALFFPYTKQIYNDKIVIYDVMNAVPFAYTIDEATLDTQVASASQVAAIQPSDVTTNTMTFVASTRDNDRYLVANVVAFPGWQITVDGKPADLVTVGGYVGVKLRPGVHTYRFSYETLGLRTGLILSGGAILVCLLWGIGVTVGPLVRSLTWLENRVRRYRQQKKGADNKNEQPGHLLLGHDS